MSVQSHIESLRTKHLNIENQIKDAYTHHDLELISKLKKEKLALKDEIFLLTEQLNVKNAA